MHYSFAMDEQEIAQKVRRKARRRSRPLWRKALVAVVVLLVLLVGGVLGWAATGPHSVSWIKDRVIARMNAKPDLFRVEVEDVVVQFDGWDDPLAIHAINTTVLLPGGQLFTSVPDVGIRAEWGALLGGEVVLDEVRISDPSIYLHRSADGHIMIGNNEGDSTHTVPLAVLFGGMQGDDAEQEMVHRPDIFIEDATLRLYSEDLEGSVDITEAYIAIRNLNDNYQLNARLPVNYEQSFTLQLNGEYAMGSGLYTLSASYDAMPVQFACVWAKICEGYAPLDATLKGTLDVALAQGEDVPRIAFTASTQNAVLGQAEWFEQPLEFPELSVRGSLDLAQKELHLAELVGATKDFSVKADGQYFYSTEPATLLLNASLENLAVEKIAPYWPHSLASQTRDWVTARITTGMVPSAKLSLKLEPKHHESEFFPAEILAAEVHVQNATVNALADAPPFEGVNATVRFTGESMEAEGTSARLGKLAISDLKVAMMNLNDPVVPTQASFAYSGALPDAITLLQAKPFTFDDHLKLSSKSAKGVVDGTIAIDFKAFAEGDSKTINWDAVQYDVAAKLNDVFYPSFMGKADIGGFAGELQATNKSFSLNGSGQIDGTKLTGKVSKAEGKAMEYEAKGSISAGLLSRYGLPVDDYVQGLLKVDAKVVDTSVFPTVTATIDARSATLKAEELFWTKRSGEAATITLNAKPDYKAQRGIITAKVNASNMQADGVITIDPRDKALKKLELSKLIFDENNVSVTYEPLQNGEFVEVKGLSLNLRPHLAQEGSQTISDFPPLHLIADVQRVYFANDAVFSNLKGKLFCTVERCNSADVRMEMGNQKATTLSIERNDRGARALRLKSGDAGQLLSALDIVTSMQGGVMDLNGAYDDDTSGNPFDGRFLISNFVLKDAPVLGKILNLASLTGLFDTLAGKGMRFDKLSSDIHFVFDTATLKDAIMKGSSVGVTADGKVHVGDAKLDLKGTVIPAYALNSLVGEIPVIGNLITGGENQGVLGVDYSVTGGYDDPQISVNPLSAFTPGFLRNIFDIFDAPEGVDPEEIEVPSTDDRGRIVR